MVFSNHVDLRKGVLPLCGLTLSLGRKPSDGSVYVFFNRSRTLMKLLHWERSGYVIYYKLMEVGDICRKVFCQADAAMFYELRWDNLVLFLEGIYLSAGRMKQINNQ